MKNFESNDESYALIGNIPPSYHSADLRRFFSTLIEAEAFLCFHYRHRPEPQRRRPQPQRDLSTDKTNDGNQNHNQNQTFCCFVKTSTTENLSRLISLYHRKHWTDAHGNSLPSLCLVRKLKTKKGIEGDGIQSVSPSRNESKNQPAKDLSHNLSASEVVASTGDSQTLFTSCSVMTSNDLRKSASDSRTLLTSGSVVTATNSVTSASDSQTLPASGSLATISSLVTSASDSQILPASGSLATISSLVTSSSDSQTLSANYSVPSTSDSQISSTLNSILSTTDLISLKEFKPPAVMMPRGNVGTPTSFYLAKIRDCAVPAGLISKLGLVFPKAKGKRKYSSVPPPEVLKEDVEDVGWCVDEVVEDVEVRDGNGCRILGEREVIERRADKETREADDDAVKDADDDDPPGEEDDETEEWERHESLHSDVTAQDRTKERLYEEEIELVWEKGGSGLLFYTDAQFWKEQEGEKEFEWETADDWDVDMSVYYEEGGGDKDARDHVEIRREERRRRGEGDVGLGIDGRGSGKRSRDKNAFQPFPSGFGKKMMERQGWKEGQGLGSTFPGIETALDAEGQAPNDRTGFGFRKGASIGRTRVLKGEERRARKRELEGVAKEDQYVLPTKYDVWREVNQVGDEFRSADSTRSSKRYFWGK